MTAKSKGAKAARRRGDLRWAPEGRIWRKLQGPFPKFEKELRHTDLPVFLWTGKDVWAFDPKRLTLPDRERLEAMLLSLGIVPEEIRDEVSRRFAHLQKPSGEELTQAERDVLDEIGLSDEPEPLIDPVQEAEKAYTRMLVESYNAAQAADLLGIASSRVRQRLTEDPPTLFGIKTGFEWRLPKFQFTEKGLVPGIGEVIKSLPPDAHPVAVERWFNTPHPDLEAGEEALSPLAWLKSGGRPATVAQLAVDF